MEQWAETCARRMAKTLTKKPRHHKTRVYLSTLPKRAKPKVQPDEFIRAQAVAKAVIGKITPPVRERKRERLTPAARKRRETPSLRKCRPGPRFLNHEGLRRPDKSSRDKMLCYQHRHALYAAQGGLCAICGHALPALPENGSLDHVIPLSLGGRDGLGNLVLTHGECNGDKSNDVPTGCELIWLLAVNARLGTAPIQY